MPGSPGSRGGAHLSLASIDRAGRTGERPLVRYRVSCDASGIAALAEDDDGVAF
ncbi:hypothetical protein YT1_0940 [Rhodococcus ruber]|nr:hypothetical protein YT1_0940 [Rhodococcus ruber]